METSELLRKVRKIEIKTRNLSNNLFSGEYHSAFKGRGMSFAEVRNYSYGDDVRNIDWNVTARTGTPHVKIFEEERELTVILLIDISNSSYFGTLHQFKVDLMSEIAAVLSFSAINNNDKVGVIFFSDIIEKFIPPKKGKKHILRIIRELINFEPQERKTNISVALQYLNNVIKKQTITFLMSDFMATGYDTALRIASRRHDIVGLHLYDRHEESLPAIGLLRAIDAETGERLWVDTDNPNVRKRYANWFEDNLNYAKTVFRKSGADLLSIRTDESYVHILLNFFKKRNKK